MTTDKTNTDIQREEKLACLTKCSQLLQHTLESIFGKLGHFVGNHPWITIIVSVVITLSFGAGFMNWTTESRINKLWIPQNTKAEQHSIWVSQVFGFETRTEQILVRPYDEGNVLTAKYIKDYYIAHYLMVNHTSKAGTGFEDEFPGLYSWDGYNASNSICLRLGTNCDMQTILDIVGYKSENITTLTDENLLELLNDPIATAGINIENIIGGLKYDTNGNIYYGAVLSGTYSVSAVAIEVNAALVDPSREAWESEVNNKILNYDFTESAVVPYFETAWSEEFAAAIGADGMTYMVGCLLLIIYTTVALGKRDYVHSMVGLALCAILTVGLSILGSYGLAGAASIMYTTLASSLPFLALGLGVDDAFIIAGEFQQQVKDHLLQGRKDTTTAELMEYTMKHAGVSILITSLTDFVAFAIGSTTVLPALKAFCLYAAFSVLFVFLLNITFFAACVVIDHRRASCNRMDCICCVKLKKEHPMFHDLMAHPPSLDNNDDTNDKRLSYCFCLHVIPPEASRKMWTRIGKQIVTPWIRNIILLFGFGVLTFGIYGALQLEKDFKLEWFIPDTSYLQEYYAWKSEFFNTGTPLFIYSKDIDYFEYKEELLQCNYLLRNASYLDESAYDWHLAFWRYADSNNMVITSDNYYGMLQTFLYSSYGAQYNGLIEWKDVTQPELGIEGAFMIGGYQEFAVANAAKQVDAMYAIREDMNDIIGENDDIFAFTFQMLFWEQFAVISVEFYRNLALAVLVVFVIALILIPKISAALLVLFAVMCTIVDVMGFMWLWGLTIDAITVCYTVIAIGLAVDYSAHVGEAYVLSSKHSAADKVIDSLRRIGASVFNGAFSTFLAVVAMANSQTYIFRVFFKEFFLVTLIGSVHGLIILPALLSWIGPKTSVRESESDRESKESAHKDLKVEMKGVKSNNENKNDNAEDTSLENDSETEDP